MSLSLDELTLENPYKTKKGLSQASKTDPSLTMEIQGRIQQDIIHTQDIKLLVKNTDKYQKVMRSQALSETQRHLFEKFRKAYLSMRNTLFVIFGAVITLILIVTTFFVVGYVKRGNTIKSALAVKQQLNSYEQKIENARKSPDGQNLQNLYEKLESKQRQLDSLKAFLDQKDQKRIFADTIEYFLDEVMRQFNESDYHIPPHMLLRVKYYIDFNTKHQSSMISLLRNRDIYFPEIERNFKLYNVPLALAYVALQESGLNPVARSSAGAVGLWQFMEATGKAYGLTINGTIDQRTDWKKSTVAAAKVFS